MFRNGAIAELFVQALSRVRRDHGLELFAWVVMPEHVHIMCRPPPGVGLDRLLVRIKMPVTVRVIARWKKLDAAILARLVDETGRPRFWRKGGGFDRNVRDEHEFSKEVRYIHWNPVERGLVQKPEDWRWSSVRWWMGFRDGEVECDPPPGELGRWDKWRGFV